MSKIELAKLSKWLLRLTIFRTFWIPPEKKEEFTIYIIARMISPITHTAAEISRFLIIV